MTPSVSSNSLAERNEQANWLQTRPGERCLIRVPAADANGAYSLVEIVSAPGDGTPLHMHQNEDEHLIVLNGVARVALGDSVFDAEAGRSITLPKNVPHAWGNRSTTQLRIAVIAYPGGVEEVLRAIARDKDVDVPALARSFGVIPIGPTPF